MTPKSKKDSSYNSLLQEAAVKQQEDAPAEEQPEMSEEQPDASVESPEVLDESEETPEVPEEPLVALEEQPDASNELPEVPEEVPELPDELPEDEDKPPMRRVQEKRPVRPQNRRPAVGGRNVKKKKKRRKHRSVRVYGVLIMLTLIFVISITLAVGIIEVGKDMLGIDGKETLVIFNIPEGATTTDIAAELEAQGIIRIPKAFIYFTRLSNEDANFIPGDHQISSAMAYESLIAELTGTAMQENRTYVDVMFPEGITLNEAAEKLVENKIIDDTSKFLYFFNGGNLGYDFENYLPTGSSKLKYQKMEGYLFPDTYNFYEGMEPDDVCRIIYLNFDTKMTEEYYERMDELGITLDELITLASMIQAEAANEDEMKDISSVFWNRLNDSTTFPKLQSDPTRKYVEQNIKRYIELKDDVIYDAYDTYVCNGLPAGAIGNPGLAAIEAALYPNNTGYYYFYANVETSITYFARTNEEHEANIEMVKQINAGTWDPDAASEDDEEGGEDNE